MTTEVNKKIPPECAVEEEQSEKVKFLFSLLEMLQPNSFELKKIYLNLTSSYFCKTLVTHLRFTHNSFFLFSVLQILQLNSMCIFYSKMWVKC